MEVINAPKYIFESVIKLQLIFVIIMVKLSVFNSVAAIKSRTIGILYKVDPDPDLDLQKKRTVPLEKAGPIPKLIFDKFEGADFKCDNRFLKF